MKNIKVIITVAVIFFTGCGKDFLDRKPLSQLTTANFYQTESDAFKAILAVYSVLQGPRFYGESWAYVNDLPSDDATHKDQPHTIDEFIWTSNAITGNDVRFAHIWALGYEGVYRANLVLENVPNIGMPAQTKSYILAEAKFLRALFYWHLVVSFENILLIKEVPKSIEGLYAYPQVTKDKVYEFIEEDLREAEVVLPDRWDAANVGRATKWAAKALLGKVYLYQQKWTDAAAKLDEVINSGNFTLLADYESVFSVTNENNDESIFEIQYAEFGTNGFFTDGGIAGEGTKRDLIYGIQNQRGQKGFGEIIATQDFVESVEAQLDAGGKVVYDPRLRLTVWLPLDTCLSGYADDLITKVPCNVYRPQWALQIKTGGNLPGEFYHVRKAVNGFVGTFHAISPVNWRMIRYSDVLLMAAEAHNEAGNLAKGAEYLNIVRDRARAMNTSTLTGLVPPFPYTMTNSAGLSTGETIDFDYSQDGLRAAIVYERRIELAFEYHRFLDMKRWEEISPYHPGAASAVFNSKALARDRKRYIPSIHKRFPIPQNEIDLSKGALVQNPGY